MSNSKDSSKGRNTIQQWFPVMNECESIEVRNNDQMQIRQKRKSENPPQTPKWKESGNRRKTTPKLFELMKECKYEEAKTRSLRNPVIR
jgi:hypothetical protein